MPNMGSVAIKDSEFKITDPAEMLVGTLPLLAKHPGEFIRDILLPEYGLNVTQLARLIGVSRSHLHHVLHGCGDVSRDLAYRLGALMNDHVADYLISHQTVWDKQNELARREGFKTTIQRLAPINPDAQKSRRAPRRNSATTGE